MLIHSISKNQSVSKSEVKSEAYEDEVMKNGIQANVGNHFANGPSFHFTNGPFQAFLPSFFQVMGSSSSQNLLSSGISFEHSRKKGILKISP